MSMAPLDYAALPGHEPITVHYRGADDLLLEALYREHNDDVRRADDDMTEKLERIAQTIQRNKQTSDAAA